VLAQVLRPVKETLSSFDAPDLLVGLGQPDDAAVWKLDDDRALVITTDFFTPVVDEAYDYGAIAAANSLSDVYAMGGKPFLALNILGLPPQLPPEIGAEILRGGAEVAKEAGVVIAGGHTIQDEEPKYGLIVLGFVHPEKIIKKEGAQAGDKLVLTKPLGFGVTTTALKQEKAAPEDIAEVVEWMIRLNRKAADLAAEFDLRGGTDVTGFSLLGHGYEVAEASQVGFRIKFSQVPFVSCAVKYAQAWTFPGGASDNRAFYGKYVTFADAVKEYQHMLLFDPQTSGGLLLAVPDEKLEDFISRAKEIDQPAWVIGEVVEGGGIEVVA
jgi:selenide,water dikinase